jgi:hypothetical protein
LHAFRIAVAVATREARQGRTVAIASTAPACVAVAARGSGASFTTPSTDVAALGDVTTPKDRATRLARLLTEG